MAAPSRGQVQSSFGLIGEVCPGVEPVDRGQTRSLVTYRGEGDTGHNKREVMKVPSRTSEKAEIDLGSMRGDMGSEERRTQEWILVEG